MDDKDRVMISDALRGELPELGEQLEHAVVYVTGMKRGTGVVEGVLRSVLFDGTKPEIEIRTHLDVAFNVVEATDLVFEAFHMKHLTRETTLKGPFTVNAARIQEIEPGLEAVLCTLALSLQRITKKS
jgi:hypothetical protein